MALCAAADSSQGGSGAFSATCRAERTLTGVRSASAKR
jgi:hypothetical protein